MELALSATDIFFYIFATLGVGFAFAVVLGKNPISSAFSLVMVFFCVSAIYALHHAHFIAALQILVYAGAIVVLFVFVIMLLNADSHAIDIKKSRVFQIGAALMCLTLLCMLVWAVKNGSTSAVKDVFTPEKVKDLGGNVSVLSMLMFSDYILPFELTSVLLLVGIVGSVALAKRKMGVGSHK